MTVLLPTTPEPDQSMLARSAWLATPDSLAVHLSQGAWQPARHLTVLSFALALSEIGVLPRLVVSLPPGSGKSELTSHWRPVWSIERDPTNRIILACYEATLAEEWGKAARATIVENGTELTARLRQDSQASNRWRTSAGGGMWTAGANGAITGRRASCLIIDDPHKGFAEAHSKVMRTNVWNFYTATGRTRLLPGGSIAVVQTRWHPDDLSGRLIERSEAGGPPWTVVRFPAIAEETESIDTVLGKETCDRLRARGIPLPVWHREQGEPLWPWLWNSVTGQWERWYDEAELADIRADATEHVWNSLYQQRPTSPEGSYFKADRWRFADEVPHRARFVRRWDLAATEEGGDFTAGALIAVDDESKAVFIVDVVRAQLEADGVKRLVRVTAELDRERYGRKVQTKVEQEGGSAGKALAKEYVTDVLAGFPAGSETTTGDKVINALPLIAQQQAGNVYLVRTRLADGSYAAAPWWDAFIEECLAFDHGHDDQVDAASHGYTDLVGSALRKRAARIRGAAGRSVTAPTGSSVGLPVG